MLVILLNVSSVFKNIFQDNARKHRLGLLTITCSVLFVAIKCIKSLKNRKIKPRRSLLSERTEPSEIIIVEDDNSSEEAFNKLSMLVVCISKKELDFEIYLSPKYFVFRRTQNYRVIGLDCEWVCDKTRHPIALLQLATSDGLCVLVRLSKLPKIPTDLIVRI